MKRGVAAALALVLPVAAAWGQAVVRPVEIGGEVERPISLSIDALAARPVVEVQGPVEHGATAAYVGPLLWPILAEAHLRDGSGRGAHLQHVLFARGVDGYTVAIAIGEVDPGFEGKPVIIAYKRDGVLLSQPRLVVPGDHMAGRAVRDLVAIEVH